MENETNKDKVVEKDVGLAFAKLFPKQHRISEYSIPFSFSKETLIRAINPLFSVNLLPLTCSQFQQQGTATALNRGFLLVQYLETCVT